MADHMYCFPKSQTHFTEKSSAEEKLEQKFTELIKCPVKSENFNHVKAKII